MSKKFINDCISRAMATLPFASINEDNLTLRAVRAGIELGDAGDVAKAVWQFVELAEQEVAIHEAAGNYIKASIIFDFKAGLLSHFESVVARPTPERVAPTCDTSVYRKNRGAEPRGNGSWAFAFGMRTGLGPTAATASEIARSTSHASAWGVAGTTFAAAKKKALAEAKRRGATLVVVIP